jgi:predicted enzyme related to lactoylglutathione lyase
MPASPTLIEFPADDPERARGFWSSLLGSTLQPRTAAQGEGWQSERATNDGAASVGVHPRGRGPGDSFSLPYFEVDDMQAALAQVPSLGGNVVHPGERWAICRDSEGNPFGLALRCST